MACSFAVAPRRAWRRRPGQRRHGHHRGRTASAHRLRIFNAFPALGRCARFPTVVRRALPWIVLAASVAAGCGAAPVGQAPPLSFTAAPLESVTASSGHLHVDVRWSPDPPVRGDDAVQLSFSDDDGAPVDGLAATVVPWMPAHGHGTSVQPETMPAAAPGALIASPVYLYMSGEWQLRMTISGARDDSAVADVQIP